MKKALIMAALIALAITPALAQETTLTRTTTARFQWDPNPLEDGPVSYRLTRQLDGTGIETIVWEGTATTSDTVTIEPGKRFFYRVLAVNTAEVESDPSEARTDTPAKVRNFRAIFEVLVE